MKKMVIILAAFMMCVVIAGCQPGEIETAELDGPYVTDAYEITAPEGWVMAESGGNIVFMSKDYPSVQSYIMVGASDQKQVDQLLENKDSIIENVKNELIKNYGEESKPEISVFEESEIGGAKCVKTVLEYTEKDIKVKQAQYSVDIIGGSAAFTFTMVGDEDFAKEFQTAADSIVIK